MRYSKVKIRTFSSLLWEVLKLCASQCAPGKARPRPGPLLTTGASVARDLWPRSTKEDWVAFPVRLTR